MKSQIENSKSFISLSTNWKVSNRSVWCSGYEHAVFVSEQWLCVLQEKRYPKFVSADMEALYIEELRSSVNLLMANLESLPVSKGGPDFKQKLKRSSMNNSFLDIGDEGDILSKSDVVLSFILEVCFHASGHVFDFSACDWLAKWLVQLVIIGKLLSNFLSVLS